MHLSIFNFKNIGKERFLWIIPFLLLFIGVFHYCAPKTDEKRVIENNSFWKKKTFDKKKYDVVIGGDSRVYRGISPGAMQTVLKGFRIINFGYGSAGYSDHMLSEIDKRIDYKSSHKIVVLGITPLTLTHEGVMNYHMEFDMKTKPEELIEMFYFKKVLQFFAPFTVKQVWDKMRGKEFSTSFHQEYIPGGWVASTEDKPWPESALKSYSTRFIDNQVDEKNIQRVLDQVKSWTEEGVIVVGMRPPTTHKMVELEDSLSGYNEIDIKTRFINSGGCWFDFNIDDYSSFDGSHLQRESAVKFSTDLANKIKTNCLEKQ